jgi:hypothetical protein
VIRQDYVFLRGEIPEERAAGDVGGGGDVVDGHRVETPLTEEVESRLFELGGGALPMPLPEPLRRGSRW